MSPSLAWPPKRDFRRHLPSQVNTAESQTTALSVAWLFHATRKIAQEAAPNGDHRATFHNPF
jgi:hypothetical protein